MQMIFIVHSNTINKSMSVYRIHAKYYYNKEFCFIFLMYCELEFILKQTFDYSFVLCLDYNHYIKDLILVTLLLGALIGCWYAYRQNKVSRRHLRRMMKDMESLHKAEIALENLQVRMILNLKCRLLSIFYIE